MVLPYLVIFSPCIKGPKKKSPHSQKSALCYKALLLALAFSPLNQDKSLNQLELRGGKVRYNYYLDTIEYGCSAHGFYSGNSWAEGFFMKF